MRYFFARLDEKRKLLRNFEKILKVFDENSIEKLHFYFIFILNFILNFIFRKFVTKNRAFGNNTSFLQQFFRFRGGGEFPPFPPWLRPCYALEVHLMKFHISSIFPFSWTANSAT